MHTFYTGWALRTLGSDLSGVADAKEAVSLLRAWKDDHPDCAAAFGQPAPETLASDAENANTAAVFDECFGDIPVVCFTPGAGPVFSMLPPVRDTALHRRRAMPRRSGA